MNITILKQPNWFNNARKRASSIKDWTLQRVDYAIVIFILGLQAWIGYDMWINNVSHPYTSIFLLATGLLILAVIMRRAINVWDMDEKDERTWSWVGWSTFFLNLGFCIACSLSFSNAWIGSWTDRKYWTVTDSEGAVLHQTEYPNIRFGYSATSPITLPIVQITKEVGNPNIGYKKHKFFGWSKEGVLTRDMGDSICVLTYHIELECAVIHDNVMALHQLPVDYEAIAEMIEPYASRVFDNARLNKDYCVLGRFVEVDTRNFDPRAVNPKVHWKVAKFTCGYSFRPIV